MRSEKCGEKGILMKATDFKNKGDVRMGEHMFSGDLLVSRGFVAIERGAHTVAWRGLTVVLIFTCPN